MKNFILKLIMMISLFFFVSCSSNFYEVFSKTTNDPIDEEILVRNFDAVNTINISWNKDDGADEYVLLRADNGAVLRYSEIYRGTNCSYKDTNVSEGMLYRYRLDKIRGTKRFEGTHIGLGVAATVTQGLLYDNSEKDKAFHLSYKVSSSCYYYKYDDLTFLVDYDWYSITVPMRSYATLKITYNPAEPTDIWFKYFVSGYPAAELSSGKPFFINNELDYPQTIYFVIQAKPDGFLSSSAFSGGDVKSYSLEICGINNL